MESPVTLLHRSTGTRIGEGLRERGHLDEAAMQRTLDAMAAHLAAMREFTDDVRVIATSALRRADNEAQFAARVHTLTGATLEIISGEEEAVCSFTGALSGIDAADDQTFGVLDVGGGSSEYAVGTKAAPTQSVSCEIGAVRLMEAFSQLGGAGGTVPLDLLQAAGAQAERALGPALELQRADRIVLVGGSATTAVSLLRGKREAFDYAPLSLSDIDAWIERLAAMPLEERKALPGINPQRADILPAGLIIIGRFLALLNVRAALVSTRDVLLGYLLRHPTGLP
jgi:exopolyphosphatase/guanosine-5'-triphosphate,3'-diphosphate pyrophosphatase